MTGPTYALAAVVFMVAFSVVFAVVEARLERRDRSGT